MLIPPATAFPDGLSNAPVLAGTGKSRALQLVSGITGERTAMNQVNAPKTPGTGASLAPSTPLPVSSSLLSRFEVTGGTDRLFFAPDVLKQASLFGEARYRLSDMIQIGASGAVRIQGDSNATEVALQLLVGPTFNFGSDPTLRNAFFLSPKIGVTATRTSQNGQVLSSGAERTMSLILGKRFALGDHLAFAPSVGVIQQGSQAPFLSVTPVALSFFF